MLSQGLILSRLVPPQLRLSLLVLSDVVLEVGCDVSVVNVPCSPKFMLMGMFSLLMAAALDSWLIICWVDHYAASAPL